MAPKAGREPTAEEWYREAVERRIAVYGSPEDAETALIAELAGGLPYSCLNENGVRVPGDRRFFSDFFLRTNRDENRAFRRWPVINPVELLPDGMPSGMIAIKVAVPADALSGAAHWIAAEVQLMREAGVKIPAGINITDYAKLLAKRMAKAAKADSSIRPVGWKHIKNKLPDWGLWPIK